MESSNYGKGYSQNATSVEKRSLRRNPRKGQVKIGSIICLVLFISGAILSLLQMWFTPLESDTFIKTLVTLCILFIVALGVTLVKKEYLDEKK